MAGFKRIYSWLHLWLGLAVGAIFTIASLSGAALVFEQELGPILYPKIFAADQQQDAAKNLSLDTLFRKAAAYNNGRPVYRLTIEQDEDRCAFIFRTEGERLDRSFLRIDPQSGELAGRLSGKENFFAIMEELHRRLFAGSTGKTITGAACIAYIFILISGLILWWPKNKNMLKSRLKIKWDAKAKRLNWDIHAVGGLYMAPILFLVCLTGLTWSYKWYNQGVFYLFDGAPQKRISAKFELPPQQQSAPFLPVQNAFMEAQKRLSYPGDIQIMLPKGKDENAIEINRENKLAAIPNVVDRLFFDQHTGKLIKEDLYVTQTRGMKVRRLILPLHTGSFGGIVTKLAYFIVMLFVASLPITGLYIYWGRKKKKIKNRL